MSDRGAEQKDAANCTTQDTVSILYNSTRIAGARTIAPNTTGNIIPNVFSTTGVDTGATFLAAQTFPVSSLDALGQAGRLLQRHRDFATKLRAIRSWPGWCPYVRKGKEKWTLIFVQELVTHR